MRAPPALRVIQGGLSTATARSAERTGWRFFWRAVARRFALRGAIALALSAADGPLPIGELISIGLALWTIWEIVQLWDVLWTEAGQQEQEAQSPTAEPHALPEAAAEEERSRRSCLERNPGASICDEPLLWTDEHRNEAAVEFLLMQPDKDFSPNDLGDCYQVGGAIPEGVINDCGLAPAIRFHCRVNGDPREISIFGCLCCDPAGYARYQWSRPHWSTNLSRRGG